MNNIIFKNFGETTLHNAFDCITIYSLQDYYDTCEDSDEEIKNALKVVLSHYMTIPDYEKWLEKVDGSN
jgi:hypothetical protein